MGLACNLCEYKVLSPDTPEGVPELMWLHMITDHRGARWMGEDGRIYGGG